jgi:hypothetical protein
MNKLIVCGQRDYRDIFKLYSAMSGICWSMGGPENVELVIGEEDGGLNSEAIAIAGSKGMRHITFDVSKYANTPSPVAVQLAKMREHCYGHRTVVLVVGAGQDSAVSEFASSIDKAPDFTVQFLPS